MSIRLVSQILPPAPDGRRAAQGLTGSQSHDGGSLKRPAPAFQSSRAVILRAYAPVNAFARRFGWDLEESFSVFWDVQRLRAANSRH